jgi:hypothetical protein
MSSHYGPLTEITAASTPMRTGSPRVIAISPSAWVRERSQVASFPLTLSSSVHGGFGDRYLVVAPAHEELIAFLPRSGRVFS